MIARGTLFLFCWQLIIVTDSKLSLALYMNNYYSDGEYLKLLPKDERPAKVNGPLDIGKH